VILSRDAGTRKAMIAYTEVALPLSGESLRSVTPDVKSLAAECRNLGELLARAAKIAPDHGFLWPEAGNGAASLWTYASLLKRARRVLGGLRAAGLRPGQNVAVALDRTQDAVEAFWACVLGGHAPCFLPPARGDLAQRVALLENVAKVLDGPALLTSREVAAELPPIEGVSVVSLDEVREHAADATVFASSREDVALLVLTSGSTGISKVVQLTHGNLLWSLQGKIARQRLTAADVTMNWISFDHVAAIIECHLLPVAVGATQLHVESQVIADDPLRFLTLIDEHRVTMTFTPNFLLGQINAAFGSRPGGSGLDLLDLSSLRIIVCGGEAIVCKTANRFLELGARYGLSAGALCPAFGMTETCAGSVYSFEYPEVDAGLEFASLGLPLRGLEMRVVDENDAILPDGQSGELQLRGPMVFHSYLNNPKATAAAFTPDGWFRTGDRGFLGEGRLTLVGRSKDSIIVNGVNYYSHDIESVLEELEGVERSYVAACPIRFKGADTEQLAVFLSPSFPLDDEVSLHRLSRAVRDRVILQWGFRPAVILPLPTSEIPKTTLGKIQRSLLRKRLEAGEFAEQQRWMAEVTARQLGGYAAPNGEIETGLADIVAEMFGIDRATLSATANFFDLGATSLDVLRLKSKVEARLDIESLPIIWLMQHPTVRDLAARLKSSEGPTDQAYDPIVPLQLTGTKTPIFCVHPGVGEVLVFVNLAKFFGGERPFYALRARGFGEGESFFTSFPEMVDCYVQAIRAKQPKGPYNLAGYSYGGAVAFEIAKVLEAQGERVSFLGIFNLPPHIKYRMEELDFTEGMVNLAFFLSLVTKEQAEALPALLRRMTKQEQLEYMIANSPAARLAELDLDVKKFAHWAELTQSLLKMGREYEPSGTVESLTVFYAVPLRGTKSDWLNKQLKAWDSFTRKPNRYIDVAGEHYTLMGAKHVPTFQAILRRELEGV
jgi:acyl-CoA synthetase (AMP-forming)/AMP-acid ligase II/thioesterase domain-containing protein/acyl carrier protein